LTVKGCLKNEAKSVEKGNFEKTREFIPGLGKNSRGRVRKVNGLS